MSGLHVAWSMVCFLLVLPLGSGYTTKRERLNYRPVIGILAQESDSDDLKYGDTYIPAPYFKYIEMGGGRAIPVFVKRSADYYEKIFNSINGLLFPGGGVSITKSEYAKAAQVLYSLALKANDNADYFPIWGTCLGFQLLTALATGKNVLSDFDAEDLALPLNFTKDFMNSRLFGNVPNDVYQYLAKLNTTENFHHHGLTPLTFDVTFELKSMYKVLSTNRDRKGKEFISTMEAINYPIYGTQWHPEKPNFMWDINKHINHGPEAIRIAQYMSSFLVAEARKSYHQFPSMDDEIAAMVDNYIPVYAKDNTFGLNYFFNYTQALTKF